MHPPLFDRELAAFWGLHRESTEEVMRTSAKRGLLGRLTCMRIILGSASTLLIGSLALNARAQSQDVPLKVSLCEIKAHPEKFLHKQVEFTAVASHGFEDSMVDDARCPWPSSRVAVWMEYGGRHSTGTVYCCGVSPKSNRDRTLVVDGIALDLSDDKTFRTFDSRLHAGPTSGRTERLVGATLRGRIFAKYEGITGTQQDPAWRGYGHMGCCILFVVTQVVRIEERKP